MDYLNNDELLKVIGDYIDSKSKYAILIDGEWGCGKTEFANGKLIEYLREKNKNNENKNKENDGICYISLYGLTTKQEIENEITAKMIEQLDITGSKFLARCFKSTKLLSKIINMGLDERIKSLVDKINIEEIVNKFQVIENQILIFDDLERIELDYNELFGLINDYVEHKGNKCIIFVNQNEIQKNNIMKNIELKYLTTEVKIGYNNELKENKEKVIINKDNLKKDLFELYSDDLSYKKIKEKVIGIEIKYIPDIINVCTQLANTEISDIKTREVLISSRNLVSDIMKREKHCNIRTLKLVIEKFEKIVVELENSQIKSLNYYQIILRDLLIALLYRLIQKKREDRNNTWKNNEHFANGTYPEFRFIDNYIMTGKLDTNYMIEVLKEYNDVLSIEEEEKESLELKQLKYSYYEMEDSEIKELLKVIFEKLNNNKYSFSLYPKILMILLGIDNLELDDFNIDVYFKLMKKNIQKNPGVKNSIKAGFFYDNVYKAKYEEYIKELNSLLQKGQKNERILGMNAIIKDEDGWGRKLKAYLNQYSNYDNNYFVKEIDIDRLIEEYKIAKVKDIVETRIIFQDAKIYKEDYDKVKKFVEMLDDLIKNETRKVQRKNFEFLSENLKRALSEIDGEE